MSGLLMGNDGGPVSEHRTSDMHRGSSTPEPARRLGQVSNRHGLLATALLLALAIFLFDTLSPLEGAVAVLYVAVVLLAARTGRRRDIVMAAGGTLLLTLIAYFDTHGLHRAGSWTLRAMVSLSAIGITAALALQGCAATSALARSESRYRRMFNASRIGVIEEDWRGVRTTLRDSGRRPRQGFATAHDDELQEVRRIRALVRVIDVNPAMLAVLGRGAATPVDASAKNLRIVSDRIFAETLDAFARGDPFFEGESEFLRADGGRTPFLYTVTFPPAEDPDGSVLIFLVDITERRQAQNALLAAQADLAHAARTATLGELSASIAHEVNQPLMAVVTNGEAGLRWLRRASPDLAEVDQALSRIVAEGNRASQIVARIRSFVKKAPVQQELLTMTTIIDEAVLLVERELLAAHVELEVNIAPDLPAVRGDRIQFQQILVNLMVNAGQALATRDAPRLLHISAGLDENGHIAVTVADNGPGIGPAELPRLFEPFFTTRQEGMGMGLAICRTTAEAYGGRLTVDSCPDEGATFRLTLPAAIQQHAAA